MPPRRSNSGSVRGPASALTSFLQGLGVDPPNRLTTWSDSSALNNGPDTPLVDPGSFVADTTVQAGPSEIFTHERPTKRARATSIDSDDLDAVQVRLELPPVGQSIDCGECKKSFSITTYTKEHPKQKGTYLCVECCYALGIDPFEKPKKPKTKPVKKEVRAKVTHYEIRKGAASLAELCIKIIGTHIFDVDQLGDIGSINMDKVCRIISKSRRLTPATAPLFYSADRTELAMYDCTQLDADAYMSLASLCPNLQELKLHLCGQLSTEVMTRWSEKLSSLRTLSLYGPFLVRKEGWMSLFQSTRLTSLSITQSPRIDLETIECLVKHCPGLTELRLAEIGQMSDVMLQPLAQLSLRHLDLSSPGAPLSDEAVTELLSHLNLRSINLSDTGLTDGVLPALAKCAQLEEIQLRNLDFTDQAVAAFFKKASGLRLIDMGQAYRLKGAALRALIDSCGTSIEVLNMHGWKGVESDALEQLIRCPMLKELDIGWCREVTDFTVKDILEHCSEIKTLRVWGCNQLTDAVPRKRGVKVIGIETHAI